MKRRRFIPYHPWLVSPARELRNNSTLSEILLWQRLKGKQMHGYDFHRQKPIDQYIVDFFCPRLMLAIEIDGSSHDSEAQQKKDVHRQAKLESMGVRFLRFSDAQVKQEMDAVLEEIEAWIEGNALGKG